MNPYESLRDDLYLCLETLFPTTEIVKAYSNGPAAQTPYISYYIMNLNPIGLGNVSGVGKDSQQQTVQQYEVQIRLEFIGELEDDFEAANLAYSFDFSMATPDTQELFQKNALSYRRRSAIKPIPKKAETEWYMCHSIDLFFGYQVVARQNVGVTINTVYLNDNIR